MIGMFSRIITQIASHSSSFFASFYGDYLSASGYNFIDYVIDFLMRLGWSITSFVMTVMDALEFVAYSFLGINFGVNDFSSLGEKIDIKTLSNVFRAIAGLAIVLMLVFTIIAMVKQEWANAVAGFSKSDSKGKAVEANSKVPFIKKILRNLMLILIMPLLVYIIFAGTTSVLNSFNLALKQNQKSTIAGQLLASSTYEANKYRMYANQNQRLPIVIKAYDDSKANVDNIDEMALLIESIEVQETLRGVATKLVEKTYGSFDSTIVKKNGGIYNSTEYSQLYEQFVCTPEQYYVMADFVDYAQQTGMSYYIKSIDDPSIEWKYVSSAVYSQSSNELTIKYVNAEIVNNGYQASAAGNSEDEYTITYTPVSSTTTPISAAIDSIMAMLGLGDYADNKYNIMDREEGFTNLVTWANEKAFLKLSDGFNIANKSTWTDSDEILLYEFYRWKYNNSLRDYTIDDLMNGIKWDVQLIAYQDYYEAIDLYSEEKYHYCICLNKNYYIVEKSETEFDNFGNPYYILAPQDEMDFLSDDYTIVTKTATDFTLKLSSSFDINDIYDKTNTSATPELKLDDLQDQIIIYEYFQDSSYQNTLRQYNFDEFDADAGVELPIYKIENYGNNRSTKYCVLLNKTFYELNESNTNIKSSSGDTSDKLLSLLKNNKALLYYHYVINSAITYKYDLSFDSRDSWIKKKVAAGVFEDLNLNDVNDVKYENYKLKFSSNFSYNDISTWSFRDIFVLYLFSQGYGYDIEYLKTYGLKAQVGKISGNYCLKINEYEDGGNAYVDYILISDIEKISTEGIYQLDIDLTLEDNVFSYANNDLFIAFDKRYDKVVAEKINYQTLEFSSGYQKDDESSWTVLDFILTYAIELGLIDEAVDPETYTYDARICVDGETYYKVGDSHYIIVSKVPNLNSNISSVAGYADVEGKLLEKDDDDIYYAERICSEWFAIKEVNDNFAVSTQLFEFSKDFRSYDDSTWTVGDFILMYASKLGYLDNVDDIEYSGYNSLIYTSGGNKYYRFGRNADNAYFLSLKDIPGGNLSQFLKKKVSTLAGYVQGKALEDINARAMSQAWFNDFEIAEFSDSRGSDTTINFTSTFEASNYKTWTQGDFILYYLSKVVSGESNVQKYITNGLKAEVVSFVSSDIFGNSKIYKALKFEKSPTEIYYVNYSVLEKNFDRKLKHYQFLKDTSDAEVGVSYQIKLEATPESDIVIEVESNSGLASFVFTDNYYYAIDETVVDADKKYYDFIKTITNVSDDIKNAIDYIDMSVFCDVKTINLKLQVLDDSGELKDFKTNDLKEVEKWTILDYIVLQEYSSNIKNNMFEGMTFKELCELDNFVNIYIKLKEGKDIATSVIPDDYEYFIELNGNYYNLTGFVKPYYETVTPVPTAAVPAPASTEILKYYECSASAIMSEKGLKFSTPGNYIFKIPYEIISFSVNPQIDYDIPQTEFTVAFKLNEGVSDEKTIYITPNENTKSAFHVNINLLDRYSISELMLSVSWPKKLMNDMLVMYPDLNWNSLLASGDWIDVLGDYISAYTNGAFVSEVGNSSNITAVGMVLSEFFLSCANESPLGYADYEYKSLFDQKVIESLMLSMLGEEEYLQLKLQASVFVDFFNSTFATVIDDIAAEENINIKEGVSTSLSVFVYKAFLATQLLSSDIGEYLYTVGNRIYAQYTIYESLAQASGNYAEYENYLNGQTYSLILKIGTEYYDITSFAEEIKEQDRLTFKKDLKYSSEPPAGTPTIDVSTLILNKTQESEILNEINGKYSIKVNTNIGSNSTIIDLIIKNELNNSSPQNILKGQEHKYSINGSGLDVDIYANRQYVLLQINNRYYNITEHVTNNGTHKITKLYKDYLDHINDIEKDKWLEKLFNSGVFTPTSYAVTEAQAKDFGEYYLNVKYSNDRSYLDSHKSELNILDAIIDIYIKKFSYGYFDLLTFNWERFDFEGAKDFNGNIISEKLYNGENYSLSCDVFVIQNENAFTYSTFEDLVKYENKQIDNTNATPIFTFNMRRVYELILKGEYGETEFNNLMTEKVDGSATDLIWDTVWNKIINNEKLETEQEKNYIPKGFFDKILEWIGFVWDGTDPWEKVYKIVTTAIHKYYGKVYSSEKTVLDSDPYYCYLYEVYYSIFYDCTRRDEDIPVYLKIYEDYLNGDLTRWNILAKENVSGSTPYIPDYNQYKWDAVGAEIKAILSFWTLFDYNYNYTGNVIEEIESEVNAGGSIVDVIGSTLKNFTNVNKNEVFSVKKIIEKSIQIGANEHFHDDYENIFGLFTEDSFLYDIVSMITPFDELSVSIHIAHLFTQSSLVGNRDAWISLVKLYNSLDSIIDEMLDIIELFETGESETKNGSVIAEQIEGSGIYYDVTTYMEAYKRLSNFHVTLGDYIRSQETLDVVIKSSITFTLAQYGKNYVTSYRFNVENRGYTLSSLADPLRLGEYVLGGKYLSKVGGYPIYTSKEFEGIIHSSKVYDPEDGVMKTRLEFWPELREFAANIAATTAKLYYFTNLTDLAPENKNGVYLTDLLNSSGGLTNIEYMILQYLTSKDSKGKTVLNPEILCSLMLEKTNLIGIDDIKAKLFEIKNPPADPDSSYVPPEITADDVLTIMNIIKGNYANIHIVFKEVMSYLLLSEDQQATGNEFDINFENITLNDLKISIMKMLVDYQSNPADDMQDNINRYLALFNLLCCQIDYNSNGNSLGTILKPNDVARNTTAVVAYDSSPVIFEEIKYKIKNADNSITTYSINATLSFDKATQSTIVEMANCENMPVEDLVQMEYESLYARTDGIYDENLGDIFVVCHFDPNLSKYVPFMAKNYETNVVDSGYDEYIDNYNHLITTNYYANDGKAYPIIAKGVIGASGLPTAIRIINGNVVFYRTNITTTSDVNDSAILNTLTTGEITTIGYTDYVPWTLFMPFDDTNKMINFIGNQDLGKVISSDLSVYFMQTDVIYNLATKDEFGGFIVLSDISAHYQIGVQTLFLMFLGFVVLIPLIFRLTLSAMRRILDIIFLVLAFPLMASVTSLSVEKQKDDAVSKWSAKMTTAMLAIFGYVIGFNVYFMLVNTVLNMDFVNILTMNNIKQIGGFGFVSLGTLNQLIRYLFLIEAVAVVKTAMTLLLPIVTGGRATDAFKSAIDNSDTLGQVTAIYTDLKESANKVVGFINGEGLIQLKDAAIESVKSMIPGSSIVGSAKENVQDMMAKKKAKSIKKAAEAHGVSTKVTSKFAKSYADNAIKQREKKREMRLSNANAFMANYAKDFDLKDNTFSKNRHIWPQIKKNFELPKQKKDDKKDDKKVKKAKNKK